MVFPASGKTNGVVTHGPTVANILIFSLLQPCLFLKKKELPNCFPARHHVLPAFFIITYLSPVAEGISRLCLLQL